MRLRLLQFLSLVLALSIHFALTQDSGYSADPRPPNVVLIIGDDMTYGDYSFLGHPQIQTPHLDKLARESLTYRRGYVPASLCRASLASIVTGLYPHQHKITSNDPPLPAGKTGAAARQDPAYQVAREAMIAYIEKSPTLPRLLGQHGYASFQSGKWWEGSFSRGGFTAGMTHGDAARGGRHGDEGLKIGREGLGPVFKFIDQAVADGKPFFVWYAPMMPHEPHNPPQRLLDKYKSKTPSLHVARYWAMCEWFDESCGQLLDYLDRKQLAENTLVVYVNDNGWIQNENQPGFAPRSKRSPYEGGLRTPIMLRWPGKIMPRMADDLAMSIDLAPTILTAAGLKPTQEMPGLNLLDESGVRGRKAIFGEIFEHNAVDIHQPASSLQFRWVIESQWKLIIPGPREGKAAMELYDLSSDPGEATNLSGKQKDTAARLLRMADEWWPGR
ncbi:MAG: sulfatase [Planctomycetia bacterium]|nr:sulfatase [Planctomycetia bacterium]